jgi:putative membrane protein
MKKQNVIIFLLVCFAGTVQCQMSERDQKFVKCAAEAGVKEVKLGELAASKGSSPEVRNLGQSMVTDHTKANRELAAIASKKGISPPTTMNEKDQKDYEALSKKQGVEFDKAYAKCMVKDHKKVLCKFKKEAKKGDDAEIKSFAQTTTPVLEHHKHMSKEACKAVKK